MNSGAFLDLPEELSGPEAPAVVVPVPLEVSVTYGKGTGSGPDALIKASSQVELYDPLHRCQVARVGIRTEDSVDCTGNLKNAVKNIKNVATTLFKQKRFPVFIGGEHSISIGIFEALNSVFGPTDIIQIDAHADLRDSYQGSRLNHACVMSRARDAGHRCLQFGIRALSQKEAERIQDDPDIECHFDHDASWRRSIDQIISTFCRDRPVYLTIDVDGLSPALMPATGTPVAGGLNWDDVQQIVNATCATGRLLGADVNELSPSPHHRQCDMICAQLVYRIIGSQAINQEWPFIGVPLNEED